MRRFFEAQNREDWATLDSLVAPNYVHHTPGGDVDWAAWKRGNREFTTAFKGRQTLEDVVVAGDRVAVRWTGRATHRGTFAGIPATGREVTGRSGRLTRTWGSCSPGARLPA